MANATIYVDNVNGNNGNTGLSEAQAFADLATALAAITGGGNTIHIQAGANYVYTATETFTAGLKGDTTDGRNRLIGYTTTPGADDGRPVITSATNSVILFTLNDNDYWEFRHLKFTHTAATRGAALTIVTSATAPLYLVDCVIDGCLALFNAHLSNSITHLIGVEIKNTTSTAGAFSVTTGNAFTLFAYGCDIHDNAGDGIRTTGSTPIINLQDCIFDTNAIGVNITSSTGASVITAHGCVFVDHTSDGIKVAATSNAAGVTFELENNVLWGNGGCGINNLDEQAIADANRRINRNNAYYNTSPNVGLAAGTGDVTLSSTDPFTNRSGRDFTPNNTAGGGALLRAAGFPGLFAAGTTHDYKDIGVQHQDSGGGGGYVIGS